MKVVVRKQTAINEHLEGPDIYSMLMTADQKADDLVMFYTCMKKDCPEFADVFDKMIEDALKHKGFISQMRKSVPGVDNGILEAGEQEAKQLIDTPLSLGNSTIPDYHCTDCEQDYFGEDRAIVSMIVDDSACEADEGIMEGDDEYIVLAKESSDPEEAFLEYRYRDELQALGSFAKLSVPAALLRRNEVGDWFIQAQTPDCDSYLEVLSEQVELLNG